ncbi:hypothetical protein [Kordiimonas sp. SCSIO 12610]|uniref:hypothetical protein n=1 Tax=Kordiimonas sp. SCSIO 12610 TaxID=2829597 RepID=UPI00210C4F2A|nr:hypothetical protein [Kordiimonas sp. SCSIO 12610]UTW55062.1 hypothetical protein KFF44_14835 [Kordiimonas sp. SCSIO 12610]
MLPHPLLVLLIAVFIALLLIPFRLMERSERLQRAQLIKNISWIHGIKTRVPHKKEDVSDIIAMSKQNSFDYAKKYSATIKGALANPNETNLQKLAEMLYDERNLVDQLWHDLARGLTDIHQNYPIEFEALTTTILENSDDYIQLHAAKMLSTGRKHKAAATGRFLDWLANHPIWRNIYNTSGH